MQLQEFFESIDTKKDNLVDIDEWTNNIITEDNLLQNIYINNNKEQE